MMIIRNLYRSNWNGECIFKVLKKDYICYLKKERHIYFKFIFFFVTVPIITVDGVIGNKVQLPCDIRSTNNDEINMVLWYKEGRGEPIYR